MIGPTFQLNAPVIISAKVKKYIWTNTKNSRLKHSSSGCAGAPSPTAPVHCHGPALMSPHTGSELKRMSSHSCFATYIANFPFSQPSWCSFVLSLQCALGHSCRGCDISHWSRECLQKFNIRVVLKSGQTWSPLNIDQVKNTPCTLNNPMWYHLQLWRSLYWRHEAKSRDKNVLGWLQEGHDIYIGDTRWSLEMRLKEHWDACPLQI